MTRLLPLLFAALLAGCASTPRIDTTYTSRNQDSRVQFLVLHYTQSDFQRSLKTLTEGAVSSHYLVNDDPPVIYRLVDETRRSWHAGVSSWQGQTQLNAASVGIEIVNRGYRDENGVRVWYDYPPAQIDAVVALVRKIVAEHRIRPDRIVGHSDIAPQRKIDPGRRFPWKALAEQGIGLWPKAGTRPLDGDFHKALQRFGYAPPLAVPPKEIVKAFQRHFRPAQVDGMIDPETRSLLAGLLDPLGRAA